MDDTNRDLTAEECHHLLGTRGVGRVALTTPTGTRIVPVNYAVYGDAIVFRTAAHGELGTYGPNSSAVFEIDNLDHIQRQGWSVVATGRLAVVDDPDERADIRRTADPTPWADGLRGLYMKLSWRDLSGCRLGKLSSAGFGGA